MSFATVSRVFCLSIFAIACALLPQTSHGFALELCQACLEEDVCNYCIKDIGKKTVGVCDCNDDDLTQYGDCEDVKWGVAKVNNAAACNLLAYPKTAEASIALILLIIVVIFCTGFVVVTQFIRSKICCCCRKRSPDDKNTEMPNLKATKTAGGEMS